MNANFDFYKAADICTESAIRYLKDQFRKAHYTEVREKFAAEIEYLLPKMRTIYGKSPVQAMRIFKMTSEFAGMLNI